MSTKSDITVPDGFTLHTENTSHILLSSKEAFLNPVQEFNRDLSVACIRVWSEELNKAKRERWRQNQEKKVKKRKFESEDIQGEDSNTYRGAKPEASTFPHPKSMEPYNFVILEALSATGLRSIRYAKEIPLVKYVIANDISSAATAAMKRNVNINQLGPISDRTSVHGGSTERVKINEGDARTLMYSHRDEKNRVDVVDLDPYGTAAPFIDAAVQCIKDNGLLCITCTDLSVLATTNYPEKCFSNYGGVPVKAEYCHEAALRLVLHALSTSASRYGRYIEPLLSLSIDFYVRLFVRIKTSPLEVKKALTKTSTYYICTNCQAFYDQPLGRVVEKTGAAGNTNYLFKIQAGPLVAERCPECDSALHMGGPMWSGPLHETDFVSQVIEHLEGNLDKYGTSVRMKGMLTVAKEELQIPFYFTPAKVAGFFHCITPPLEDVAGWCLKTTATRQDIHSIFRSWIKSNPVKMENVPETSPVRRLLAKEPDFTANFERHPDSLTSSEKMKLVRYQENPTSHWGPGTKAVSGNRSKRKRMNSDADT